MKGRLLLNVVIGKSTAILKLFAGKNETLLVRRNTKGNEDEFISAINIFVFVARTLPCPEFWP